jgi:hypothetical protein
MISGLAHIMALSDQTRQSRLFETLYNFVVSCYIQCGLADVSAPKIAYKLIQSSDSWLIYSHRNVRESLSGAPKGFPIPSTNFIRVDQSHM